MALILAALAGVLFASGMMAHYNHRAQQKQLRSATTIDIISWADDVYDRLITIQAEREAHFSGTQFGLSNEEFRTTVKEVKSMLLASKTRAKVLLVYGEGPELMKFDSLHDEFISVTDHLLKATKDSWQSDNDWINERFSKVIEPLIRAVEELFIRGARSPGANRTLLMPPSPRLYLPHANEDIVMKESGGGSALVGRILHRQLASLGGAAADAARVLLILAVVSYGAWLYFGRPDISWIMPRAVPHGPGDTPPAAGTPVTQADLCIDSPASYGLTSHAEFEVLATGAVLPVRLGELPLKLRVRNNTASSLTNPAFMLSLPPSAVTVREPSWKPSWQELATQSGRRLILNMSGDIPSGGTAPVAPYVLLQLPAPGDYPIFYTFFADGLAPRNGHFIVKVTE